MNLKLVFLIVFGLLLQACSFQIPQAPGHKIVSRTVRVTDDINLEIMNNPAPHGRNLVFVAEDTEEAGYFESFLADAYPDADETPRLEQVAWWLYAPALRNLYDNVFHIEYGHFNKASFQLALKNAQDMGVPFDVVLFTHGVPNNIVTSPSSPLYSWQDLDALNGTLTHLRMVFMQGCFGSSLISDWLGAGAKAVLSFPDLNRNFFYLEFLLERLNETPEDIAAAYLKTNDNVAAEIRKSLLYKALISALHEDVDHYLAASPNPSLAIVAPVPVAPVPVEPAP